MNPGIIIFCVIVPSVLVILTAVLVTKQHNKKTDNFNRLRESIEAKKISLPVRLQAYERMTMLMERISPEALLFRVSAADVTAKEYEGMLLDQIRTEWNHNLSQQIYLSQELWNQIRTARGNIVQLISICSERVHPESPATELSKRILATLMELDRHPARTALDMLRAEAFTIF